ncbi:MAG TPA: holo-ACP synthase [Desulfurivibrio alkaliphilus]|uniref:Holo-[acyl-carrier-protein] synthase n=1 Tax=Desulfurivibrio alkaliphilus TaxID=427923 RepID=A0A7C2XQQ5_9BACT|nr:holo-ACP synthase [Desulfurivibrio alkaliphilus]
MIYGIGTDIVKISRMEAALARHGERFAHRILAATEWDDFGRTGRPAALLAKRFAAKEAAAKAFGTGFSAGLGLHDIAVDHDRRGRPRLIFSGKAEEFCRRRGIGRSLISLADEKDYAIAFVTLLFASDRQAATGGV